MENSKKIIIGLVVVVVVALLVFFGLKKQAISPIVTPETQNITPPGGLNTPNPSLQNPEAPKADESNSLVPLPADNNQAIESEIKGIDRELQQADDILSTDTQDAELGL